MPTIKANAQTGLGPFLTALAASVVAGDKFDTTTWHRGLIPNRVFSSFPIVDMVPNSGVVLPTVNVTPDGWLYDKYFPQPFGKFLMDFQAATAAGYVVDSLMLVRTNLKPYSILNVKFLVKSIVAKMATTTRSIAAGVVSAATLWTFTNSTASDFDFVSSDATKATVATTGAVTPVAIGTTTVTAKLKGTSTVLATITVTVTA